MTKPTIVRCVLLAALLVTCCGAIASAADVAAGLSGRETYVGLPVRLQIRISNASESEPPTVPTVDGLVIEDDGVPQRSSRTSIINGHRSSSHSLIYTYRITPQREGTFTIPSFTVQADGESHSISELQLVATTSETGDLMFAEIVGNHDRIYVGQSLDLSLKIWLRPYRDKERSLVLSEGDMWNSIAEETNWGPFTDRMKELNQQNQRPGGQEVLRDDGDGNQRSYYLYEIGTTVYPQRPGKIDGDDVQIIVRYPTELGQARDPLSRFFGGRFPGARGGFDDDFFASPFQSRLSVTAVRPLVVNAEVQPIQVQPIPSEGRPADYRGAVGQYQIVTEANPVHVQAGDPIRLHVGIAGSGPMDRVQAPPLSELAMLTDDFRVPDEPLAGIVDGEQKLFSTTIRPRKQGITEIPGIPLSYFDPDQEKFVTVYSHPIQITVDQADTLELSSIVSGGDNASSGDSSDATTNPSLVSFDNFSGQSVLNSRPGAASLLAANRWWLAAAPLVTLLIALLRVWRPISSLSDQIRSPLRICLSRIEAAESNRQIGNAFREFLTRQFRRQLATETPAAAIGVLRKSGSRQLAIRSERLLEQCDDQYSSNAFPPLDDLQRIASELVHDIAVESLPRRPVAPRASKRSTVTTATVLCFSLAIAATSVSAATTDAADTQVLLDEATVAYEHALDLKTDAPADSQASATEAATKYQLIVDSGVESDQLYFNLANAYQLSGQSGRAIANYYRALKLDPTNAHYRANLDYVQSTSGAVRSDPPRAEGIASHLNAANQFLTRYVHPNTLAIVAVIAWIALWAVISIGLLNVRFAWKSIAVGCLLLFVLAGGSFQLAVQSATDPSMAVLVPATIELRSGDGEQFASTGRIEDAQGRRVELIHRRNEWAKILVDANHSGWVRSDQIEVI
ncbi:BatD family protein [Stieleria sp. TO1_6]|uniref:BatD family protein n=1 Tax=Stieleria tagensis TaxID=2956795 RepID=UPI00209A82CA|nr:BatD family protein [Stieleria tagensis]MCO8122173.1 BatD family protein [Stieleria tagensis]